MQYITASESFEYNYLLTYWYKFQADLLKWQDVIYL
jgi:hypothetical protein